jgi:hypothetical protein
MKSMARLGSASPCRSSAIMREMRSGAMRCSHDSFCVGMAMMAN